MEKNPVSAPAAQLSALSGGKASLTLSGDWVVAYGGKAQAALRRLNWPKGGLEVDGRALSGLDPSGAWILVLALREAEQAGASVTLTGFSQAHAELVELVENIKHPANPDNPCAAPMPSFFITLGKASAGMWREAGLFFAFFGMCCTTLLGLLRRPQRFRLRSTVYHVYEIGIRALPIVSLMAFLIAIVLGYQGAYQLEKFGATMFTVDLVAISVFREMGVLITAIMVAGRSGSAFAAQIGVMQVNEEVDALRSIGLDPFELLVLPRLIAIVIALPILTLVADAMGMLGNWFVASLLMDMSWLQFTSRVQAAISPTVLLIGLGKAPVFALLIGMVGCLQGMMVEGSAADVGRRTTTAVVQSIFLVILADAAFSVLFTLMRI